jgi:RNA polymerase sigma factor (sigma-70 family)
MHQSNAVLPSWPREAEGLLIDRTLQGRADAFGELVQPYLTPLNRLARMRLRSESEAEDVVQQSVLRAFCHLAKFRRDASFKTWLCAIAFNEVNQLRRVQAVVSVRHLHEGYAGPSSSSPDLQFQRRQEAERLHQALARLPEKYRLLIQLRDLHELSVAETARSLSLSVAAVRTRHHRARKLLVRSLGGARKVSRESQVKSNKEVPCKDTCSTNTAGA